MPRSKQQKQTTVESLVKGLKEAKAVVFGRMYKRGRESIKRQVGEAVLDKLMETVDGVFPGVKQYYSDTMKELKQGYLVSYFGRKRRFPLITEQSRSHVEKQAVNFKPQSAGSDIMLYCMLYLWNNRKRWDIIPSWPVHDSITWNQRDTSHMAEIKKELEEYSLELVKDYCPFVWEIDSGINWSMAKGPSD